MMREDALLKERIYERRLPSGLRAFVIPKPGFRKKYATFGTRYGSLDSRFHIAGDGEPTKVPDGIAHFLEHKLFEEEGGNVADRFAEIGAAANAYTNYGTTMYLFSATERFDEALSLLLGFVRRPHFTEENVKKEQGIIEQELRMYMDDPHWRVFHNLLAAVYHQHPVRIDIGGTPESIRRITADDLKLCYRSFYTPQNMAFIAVGDLDAEKTLDSVEQQLEAFSGLPVPQRLYPSEPKTVREQRVQDTMPLHMPLLEMGFKEAEPRVDDLATDIVTGLLLEVLFGPSTDWFNRLYEQGLINERFGSQYFAGPHFGLTIFAGETADPDRLVEEIHGELRRAQREGLPQHAVERARRKGIGEFVGLFDSPEAIAHVFSECHFKGQDIFAVVPTLRAVTMEMLMDRLQNHFGDDNWAASVLRPQEEESSSP